MAKLDGKVAVITGAFGGISEAPAEALSAEGATVVVAARREDRLEDLVERINGNGSLQGREGALRGVAPDVRRQDVGSEI
jgi:NADP-dependent 3-hydroxy acid dehydrogenase YdfG